jgi:hypothetical protein
MLGQRIYLMVDLSRIVHTPRPDHVDLVRLLQGFSLGDMP